MAKAVLGKSENRAEWALLGRAVAVVKGAQSFKEFADRIGCHPDQVSRWIEGKERPQLDAIFAVPALRGPLVIALAALAEDIDVSTTITVRRRA